MLVRRSNVLLAPAPAALLAHGDGPVPDAVTLDLAAASFTAGSAERARTATAALASRGVDVFVRLGPSAAPDLAAVITPGVAGVMTAAVDGRADMLALDAALTRAEESSGVSLAVIVSAATPAAVWWIADLLDASDRAEQVWLDEEALCAALGVDPHLILDPCEYARGRVINEAVARGLQPIASVPFGRDPSSAGSDRWVELGMAVGAKGFVLRDPSPAHHVERRLTPDAEAGRQARRVCAAFEAAAADGVGAVALDGRMIDLPVYRRARIVLDLLAATTARDARKSRCGRSRGVRHRPETAEPKDRPKEQE